MKAVNYQGAFKVKVEDVPMPTIEHPDDVIVKVTTSGKVPPRAIPQFLLIIDLPQPFAALTFIWYEGLSRQRRLKLNSYAV
jgi:hypothetical protein